MKTAPLNSFLFLFLFVLFAGHSSLLAQGGINKNLLNQIILTEEGDFNGLKIGQSKLEIKELITNLFLAEEDEYYLYYESELESNSYYLDLLFENERLISIDAYLDFGTTETDLVDADKFYEEMKTYLTNRYGTPEDYDEIEYTYTYWYLEDRDIEVGVHEGEVYWFIMEYDEQIYGDDFPIADRIFQEVKLKDVFLNLDKDFLGIQLEDTRLEVISKLPIEKFDDAGLHELFYYWELGTVDHYLDLYFTKQDVLEEVEAYLYFYSETMEMDTESALDFYYELITLFSNRYGNEYEANQYENEYYLIWTLEDKGVEIGLYDNEVYWYFYGL